MGMTPQAVREVSCDRPIAELADVVIDRYWERAYRFAALVSRNDQDSLDIAQEALLQVVKRLEQFDPRRGSLDSWLWRIVVNVARDAGRASARRASLLERLRLHQRGIPEPDVEERALRRLTDEQVMEAVRRLKPRARTLIALRFGAQLSYGEIAEHLHVSEAAALMATRRALHGLREHLDEVR